MLVTGAASGIGRAVACRSADVGARHLTVTDLNLSGASAVASIIQEAGSSSAAVAVDVTDELDVRRCFEEVQKEHGPVDIVMSNAGLAHFGGIYSSNAEWQQQWDVHVMAHVYWARVALPAMVERGAGHFIITSSAAGLLTRVGAAPYTVSKHAAIALAEWLAVTYGSSGVGISCLCPLAVRTPMLDAAHANGGAGPKLSTDNSGVIEPDEVARIVVDAIEENRFLVLSHPAETSLYIERKHADHERWLNGMRRQSDRLGQRLTDVDEPE